jgi:hypothetical protein
MGANIRLMVDLQNINISKGIRSQCAGRTEFRNSIRSRPGRLSMSALSAAECFEMDIWRVFDASTRRGGWWVVV